MTVNDDRRNGLRLLTGQTSGMVSDMWMTHMLTKLSLTQRDTVKERDYWIAVGSLSVASDVSLNDVKIRAIRARLGALPSTFGTPTVSDYEKAWWASVAAGSTTP